MDRDEILRVIEQNRTAIRRFGVRRLGVFGSYARGDSSDTSDIDFLVEFDEKTFDNYMDLKFFLEGLFGRRVDLVIKETVKPRIRDAVFEETVYAEGL